jgi:hypothetical protein
MFFVKGLQEGYKTRACVASGTWDAMFFVKGLQDGYKNQSITRALHLDNNSVWRPDPEIPYLKMLIRAGNVV